MVFSEFFWSKDIIFTLANDSEQEKDIVYFIDGTSFSPVFGGQSQSLLIAIMLQGKNDIKDKKLVHSHILEVLNPFIQTLGKCL